MITYKEFSILYQKTKKNGNDEQNEKNEAEIEENSKDEEDEEITDKLIELYPLLDVRDTIEEYSKLSNCRFEIKM